MTLYSLIAPNGWMLACKKYLAHGTDLTLRRADAVFTVSEFSRTRIQAIAKDRDWGQAGHVGIIRPCLSNSLRQAAEENSRNTPSRGKLFYIWVLLK